MAKYFINNNLGGTQQALAATSKSLVTAASSATTKRIRVFEIKAGQNGTTAAVDTSIEFDMVAVTVAGTGTAITPLKFDQADGASLTSCLGNLTVEPTVTANSAVWSWANNQRGPAYWAAWDASAHLVSPATAAAGWALRAKSPGYVGTATGALSYDE